MVILEPKKIKSVTVSIVCPSVCHEVMGMFSFKSPFSLSSFTFIKRLFSSSLLSAVRVVLFAYLRLLILLLAILIPACASSIAAFHMMYSANRVTIYSHYILLSQFWTSALFMSSSNCCLLSCIQASQETDMMIWYSHVFKNFSQFVVIHTVNCVSLVSETEVDGCFSGISLLFLWTSRCWQFVLWFLGFF